MKRIMLVCNAGMSTSLMVNNMRKVANAKQIDVEVFAAPEAEAQKMVDQVDIILLGPQVSFILDEFKAISDPLQIPVAVIDTLDYGRMNGDKVLSFALSLLKD